jgi:hypothetical protein
LRDITELGHCNFQFYDNAAGHYFSPAALLVCRQSHQNFVKRRACPHTLLAPGHLSPPPQPRTEVDEDVDDKPQEKIGHDLPP